MDSLRITPTDTKSTMAPCSRCGDTGGRWDQIADKVYCPNCLEMLAVGEAEPLVERTQRYPCAACHQSGTICYLTYPLQGSGPLEMDLCPEHLRALLGRRLGPHAFHQLRRQLRVLNFSVEEIFLLHGAFYDTNGRALQPAVSLE